MFGKCDNRFSLAGATTDLVLAGVTTDLYLAGATTDLDLAGAGLYSPNGRANFLGDDCVIIDFGVL